MTGMFPYHTQYQLSDILLAPGVYHGNLKYDSTSDDLIDGAQLLPYPTFSTSPSLSPGRNNSEELTLPISMVFTEFHFVLLYRDRIIGVSTLNEQVTYEDILPLVSRHAEVPTTYRLTSPIETQRTSSGRDSGSCAQDLLGLHRPEHF
jgi:hypothetical protein